LTLAPLPLANGEDTEVQAELALVGGGGEPVDLWRTLASHGLVFLPPNVVDENERTFTTTLRVDHGPPRTLRLAAGPPGVAVLETVGRRPPAREHERLVAIVRHALRLEEDLSGFYDVAAADPELAWAAGGAGRLLRSPTVFEDVVKTICTTNCTWAATQRMVGALVEELGEPGRHGRAFPTPAAMAEADEAFYRDVARAGYRGAYLRSLAASVADGSLDLEALGDEDVPEDEVERQLLALPGVGPYAAAHVMLLLGRYSRLVLDSWTRPTYIRLAGMRSATDRTIGRRFRRYGRWAGLAFWLYVTRDWVADEPPAPVP
jgi:3-methyladenine DNA glycosylase/8-oxoguanine DNA glycosylase